MASAMLHILSRHGPRAARNLLTAAVSLGLSFGAVELAARRIERRRNEAKVRAPALPLVCENPHGTGSYRLRPNLDLTTAVKGMTVRVRTNSSGMHWREVSREKPPHMRRIAFLGDSFAFGCWTPGVERSFVGVFEESLNHRRFEALNFGVGGYGLDDMELLLSEEALAFSPDWVFVTIFTGNDFRDTWLGLNKHRVQDGVAQLRDDTLAERVPEPLREAPDRRLSPPAEDPARLRRALKQAAVFRLLLPRLGLDNPWIDFRVGRRFTTFTFWSQQPLLPIMLRARDRVLQALGRMDALAREHGARLAVVTIPYREQVFSRPESGPGFDVQFPQVWVRVWARENGVPYLDLLPRLRERALLANDDLYLEDDIHFGERGHAIVGRWLADWFTTELLPAARRDAEREEWSEHAP